MKKIDENKADENIWDIYCSCSMFGAEMPKVIEWDGISTAEMQGEPLEEPFKYCPWCGATLTTKNET